MDSEPLPQRSPSHSDAYIAIPTPYPRRVPLSPSDIERERLAGFPTLNPIETQLAIDFVMGGLTLKQCASAADVPMAAILRMIANPLLRAFISDLQKEMLQHRLLTEHWVEANILKNMPKFEGDEPIPVVTRDGDQVMRLKFHSKELVAIYKQYGGNQDQKKHDGVHVTIDFGAMGVRVRQDPDVIDV